MQMTALCFFIIIRCFNNGNDQIYKVLQQEL